VNNTAGICKQGSSERWARVKEIFHAALEREEKERPEFVAKACGADEELCREIESLLREHSTAHFIVSPVRQPDLSGQIITHYRIIERLGRGGMGVVHKAEDLKLGRTVALKFLAPHVLANEKYRARFIQEAKVLAAIDHPNICAVHKIDEANGQIFFAMKFIEPMCRMNLKRSSPRCWQKCPTNGTSRPMNCCCILRPCS
jgi:serine/threonine protein kinase